MALVDRAKNILLSPKSEWAVIASEEPNTGAIISGYAMPLILLNAVASFIGYGFIGVSAGLFTIKGIDWGLYQAVMVVVGGLLNIFITPLIVDALAPSFGSEKNKGRATQLVVYSMTAAWVAGILTILPMIAMIAVLAGGIYGLYLIYLGLPHTMKTPQDKVAVYMVVTIVCLIVVYFVIGAVLGPILMRVFGIGYGVGDLNIRY